MTQSPFPMAQAFFTGTDKKTEEPDMTNVPRKQTIFRIVITGGPCAGKTTAMSWIQNAFTQKGWLVLFVDETSEKPVATIEFE